MNLTIGIVGSGDPEKRYDPLAEEVGALLAGKGAVIVCGGLSGIMEAACRGSRSAGGDTIGILPGSEKKDANPYIGYAIPTGMGVARNVLIVRTSDALIAFPGGPGTMSEIALALNIGKPVIDLGHWNTQGTIEAETAAEAVSKELDAASLPEAVTGTMNPPG